MTPAKKIDQLRDEIRRHEELYYVHDAPEIEDARFDALMKRVGLKHTRHSGAGG